LGESIMGRTTIKSIRLTDEELEKLKRISSIVSISNPENLSEGIRFLINFGYAIFEKFTASEVGKLLADTIKESLKETWKK